VLLRKGADGDRIKVVFVSVDPERYTQAHLKEYMSSFDARIVAVSGLPETIAAVARATRISRATSTTSISIRSSIGTCRASAIGHTVASIAMSHVGFCRRIGAAMLPRLQALSENNGRPVGNGEGAVAHPTF
jgi:cytochrome oxidase Cu insertion factor (SCO1/SenC/PrrC family)